MCPILDFENKFKREWSKGRERGGKNCSMTQQVYIHKAHPKVDVTKYNKESVFEFGANFEIISMLTLDWFVNKYPAYHHTVISTAMSAQIRMKTKWKVVHFYCRRIDVKAFVARSRRPNKVQVDKERVSLALSIPKKKTSFLSWSIIRMNDIVEMKLKGKHLLDTYVDDKK
ncbi:hypothetical protein V1478_013206 [Vespula squamosa]|uniref:Uncharacterized protein n=1 Tax=Vespula squamosa TaxID=30214 RepID=A0ABD2AA59_VESSQ